MRRIKSPTNNNKREGKVTTKSPRTPLLTSPPNAKDHDSDGEEEGRREDCNGNNGSVNNGTNGVIKHLFVSSEDGKKGSTSLSTSSSSSPHPSSSSPSAHTHRGIHKIFQRGRYKGTSTALVVNLKTMKLMLRKKWAYLLVFLCFALILIMSMADGIKRNRHSNHDLRGGSYGRRAMWNDDGDTNIVMIDYKEYFPQVTEYDPMSDDKKTKIHVVFSTDCNPFQHWQSYLLFYSALRVGQSGYITRIASGCSEERGKEIMKWHNEHIRNVMSHRFKLHLTPKFNIGYKDNNGNTKEYKYANKPNGLKHWLEHGEDMGLNPITGKLKEENDVIILLDPDMILLRPIGIDFTNTQEYIVDEYHTGFDDTKGKRKFRVEHGSPFAQRYGFGDTWARKGRFDLAQLTGDPNTPALQVSTQEASKFYPVGPPYLATGRDMYNIALKWAQVVKGASEAANQDILAEMYAYCIAAAHLRLPHQIVNSLMVSSVDAGSGEGWNFVDGDNVMRKDEVCHHAAVGYRDQKRIINEEEEEELEENDGSESKIILLPNVLHYCSGYRIGPVSFTKYRMKRDFFTCEEPLMAVPPRDIASNTNYRYRYKQTGDDKERIDYTDVRAKREAFMVCGALNALNEASDFYKRNHCLENSKTRWDKTGNVTLNPVDF